MGTIFWVVLACAFAVIEIVIPALITIWFAIAAVILMFVSFLFPAILWNPFLEWKIFIMLSVLLLILTRPFTKKYLNQRKGTFYDNFIGKEIHVTKVIEEGYYEGKFKGVIWTLISEDHSIREGDVVIITAYEGNRVIVKKKEV